MLFNLRHVIHIPSLLIASLLWCRCHFSNAAFIDAMTKCRGLYLWRFLNLLIKPCKAVFRISDKDVLGTSLRDVLRMPVGYVHPLELYIKPYGDVLTTGDVRKILIGDNPWHYILDNMRMFSERYIGVSSGRHISTSWGRQ